MSRAFLLPPCLAIGLLAAMAAAAEAPPINCRVPNEIVDDDPILPLTARRFEAKQPLRIVAIGGASTAGTAAGDNGTNSYPHRLEEALRQRHPGVDVTVINKGVARQTTAQMVQRFASDVFAASPTLVIWETGTVDAVRGIDIDQFAAALEAGIAALRDHHLDIMLVNMQYNPSTGSVINFEPYLEALQHAADFDDVYLFKRYEIMKYWSETGVFDLADVPKDQRPQFAAEVYRCLGEVLAEAIDHAAR
jgi:lysophospholipase L1-like esterase